MDKQLLVQENICIFAVDTKIVVMAKGYVETVNTVIRDESGIERVVTSKKLFRHSAETENFYMVFVNYVQWMYDLKGIVPLKILHYMLEEASVNTGKVSLSTGQRRQIINSLKISRCAFYKAINQLVEAKAISKVYFVDRTTGEKKESPGDYLINPTMFWKGDKTKRKELKVTFEAVYEGEPLEA